MRFWGGTPGYTKRRFALMRGLELARKEKLNRGRKLSCILYLPILSRVCNHRVALHCKKPNPSKANKTFLFHKLPQDRGEMALGFSNSSWFCQAP